MSVVLFVARAFDVGVIMPNAVQYIQKVFLTSDGSNTTTTGIMLDGTTNGGITITNLPSQVVLWTDANGKIIGSTSQNVYNFIKSFITATSWANWTAGTWITSGRVNNGMLFLQYSWVNGTWIWQVGLVQWMTWATWATGWFSWLNCTAWQIAKYNGSIRECSGDLQWGWWWNNYYTNTITWMNFNSGNNMLTLYISGSTPLTVLINLSGVNNWNAAYTRMTTSWNVLRNWYQTTWVNINALATATLNCTSWQIPKFNGTIWVCGDDLTWWGVWWLTNPAWANTQIQYNNGWIFGATGDFVYSWGRLWVGIENPQANIHVEWTFLWGINNSLSWSNDSAVVWWSYNMIHNDDFSFIWWWYLNMIYKWWWFIGWWQYNQLSGIASTIVWWSNNISRFDFTFIWWWKNNTTSWELATIGGWKNNTAYYGDTIGWWSNNKTQKYEIDNTIAWWSWNAALWSHGAIWWWISNIIGNDWYDTAYSMIWGWFTNTVTGEMSSIWWWWANTILWDRSTIPWWWQNKISWDHSFAAWTNARAINNFSFVWNDDINNNFTSTMSRTFLVHAINGVGINTNAPTSTLDISWNLRIRSITEDSGLNYLLAVNDSGTVYKLNKSIIWWGWSSLWTMNGNDMYNNNRNTGKVGVGTTSPKTPLQVVGNFTVGDYSNSVTGFSTNSSILGWIGSRIIGINSSIGGWFTNYLLADDGFIWWGIYNEINEGWTWSFIWWGYGNMIEYSDYSVIAWWKGNSIHIISWSWYSVIPGWFQNNISASYSFAAWANTQAFHDNSFIWNSVIGTMFVTTKPGTFLINAPRSDCGGTLGCWGVGIDTNKPAAALDVSGTILGNNIISKDMVQWNELMANISVTTPVMNLQPDATISSGASCSTPGAIVYNYYDFYGCSFNWSYSVRKKLNN